MRELKMHYELPPPVPNYNSARKHLAVRTSDSFEQLMNAYGLNRVLVDEIPRLFSDDYGQTRYDPVHIAASSYSHLPLLSRPCTSSFQNATSYQPHSHSFMRRRSSLVEALNNGILAPIYPSDSEDSKPLNIDQRRRLFRKKYPDADEEREQEERLKMLRRRAIIRPNQPTGKYPVQHDDFNQPPRALLRSYNHQITREKRAQSQPLYQHNNCTFNGTDDSDDEITKLQPHISRADRFSIDSDTGRISQDSGIRSSTHSNNSSATTSTISNEDRNALFKAEAIFDHVAMLSDELPFSAGDSIQILDSSSSGPLWYGACRNRTGWFPKTYVSLRSSDSSRLNSTLIACNNSALSSPNDDYPMRYQRRRVIEELMGTERDYVTLLRNLVEGFVEQCRRRNEMFPEERIRKIFANIEQIANLHAKLLRELELSFDQKTPENSCLANAFLRNSQSFGVYTEYCNNRPVSCAELEFIEKQPQFHHFFEACRLLRGMPKLSLEGFLLTPVQRICRYPLQLLELLKATPETHPDRYLLEKAQSIMKSTAGQINDNKRRIDAIQKIILWQRNVHGFRGPDLIESNNRIILSGEMLVRAISKNSVQWSKPVLVYLFDQSIVLCKKDVLKKGSLVFKDRMSLQSSSIIDVQDGKDLITDSNLKNTFKVMSSTRQFYFTCSDNATKSIWLDNLRARPASNPPTPAEKRLALITLSL